MISSIPVIKSAIERIIKISMKPKAGNTNTRIATAALTIPAPKREITADVSYTSLLLKPSTILTTPLASKPSPRRRISHWVVSLGVKKPNSANPIIAEPSAIFIMREDLFIPGERTPLAILSAPRINRVISIGKEECVGTEAWTCKNQN